MKPNSRGGKVRLSVRLDHQVEFGEEIVILGSAKELGSWKKKVPLKWSENGWICELELNGGESIEYKFVIVGKDKSLRWESGDNRILNLPQGGSFGIVCHWNVTGETADLLPSDLQENTEDMGGNNGSRVSSIDTEIPLEVESSPFVGQWQGKAISFMRSNEHQSHETERKWDTIGLQGLALKLVESDKNSRNWWRKVMLLIMFHLIFFRSSITILRGWLVYGFAYIFTFTYCAVSRLGHAKSMPRLGLCPAQAECAWLQLYTVVILIKHGVTTNIAWCGSD